MNEVINALCSRRCYRSYLPEQIPNGILEEVLRAGTYAPSGNGRQPVTIVVLQKPEDIAALERLNASFTGNPEGHPFYGAPTVCVVLVRSDVSTAVEDGSLVMGNLLNAAAALGLGSCWIHRARESFATEEGKAMLKAWGITEDVIGVGHCILGYRGGEPSPAQPRKENYIVRV